MNLLLYGIVMGIFLVIGVFCMFIGNMYKDPHYYGSYGTAYPWYFMLGIIFFIIGAIMLFASIWVYAPK